MILQAIFSKTWAEINQKSKQIQQFTTDPLETVGRIAFFLVQYLYRDHPLLGTLFILESRTANKQLEALMITPELNEFNHDIDMLLSQAQQNGSVRKDINIQALRQSLVGAGENLLLGRLWSKTSNTFQANYNFDDAMTVLLMLIKTIKIVPEAKMDVEHARKVILFENRSEAIRFKLFPEKTDSEIQWIQSVRDQMINGPEEVIIRYLDEKNKLHSAMFSGGGSSDKKNPLDKTED